MDSFAAYPSVQLHNTIYVVITQYEPRKVHRLLMRSIEYLYFTDTVLQSQFHGKQKATNTFIDYDEIWQKESVQTGIAYTLLRYLRYNFLELLYTF